VLFGPNEVEPEDEAHALALKSEAGAPTEPTE
jgi:hypothetical protein